MDEEITHSLVYAVGTEHYGLGRSHRPFRCGRRLPGTLALPADKILRISKAEVEFEHHGYLPISSAVEAYQHWDDEIFPIPLDAVKVGLRGLSPLYTRGNRPL